MALVHPVLPHLKIYKPVNLNAGRKKKNNKRKEKEKKSCKDRTDSAAEDQVQSYLQEVPSTLPVEAEVAVAL